MENKEKEKAYYKVLKTIESCTNSLQLSSARKFIDQYQIVYLVPSDELFHLNLMLEKKIEELSNIE